MQNSAALLPAVRMQKDEPEVMAQGDGQNLPAGQLAATSLLPLFSVTQQESKVAIRRALNRSTGLFSLVLATRAQRKAAFISDGV